MFTTVRVRVLGHGFGVWSRKVKSRDCALAIDLVRAFTKSIAYKLSRDFSFSSFPGGGRLEDPNLTLTHHSNPNPNP